MYRYRDTEHIDITPVTETGGVVTIDNADDVISIQDLTTDIEPIQSLNGYDKPWVGGAGKNKLPTTTTQTVMGITFTANADGTVTANNTATAGADCYFVGASGVYDYISNITTGSYKLSGNTLGGGTSTFFIVEEGGTILAQQTDGNDATVTLDSTKKYRIFIRVNSGKTLSNQKYYPMLRKSTDSATFEPYENICPISGHTDVVVSRASGQLIDTSTNESGAIDASGNEVANATFSRTDFIPIDKARICIKTNLASGYVIRVHGYSASKTWVQQIKAITTDGTDLLVGETVPSGVVYVRLSYPTVGVNNTELWQADTYTTALGTTVYGGTLDVTSGVLTVDRASINMDREWVYDSSVPRFYTRDLASQIVKPSSANEVANIISSAYRTVSFNELYAVENGTLAVSTGGVVSVINRDYTDATAFKTAMSGQTIVYELATPTTTTLTAQQISTLLGQNNIWSNSGNIKVVYAVDLKKYVTLPKEAVSINGTYIEKILDGYSTLYVKGRESLGVELNTYSVGTANGEKVKGKRYPARVLTVGFQLLADNEAEFRQRFNQLNNLLSLDEADFVFNDEQDKYFTGYPVMDASVEAGRNNVTGEWKIYCAYPFKRSVEVRTLSSTDASGVVISGSSATFTFDYNGTQPARPILRAEFASTKSGGDYTEDGDCGFVAFLDPDENIIQLGNPDVINVDALNKNATLANSVFDAFTGWTNSGLTIADISDAYWNKGTGQTQKYAKGTGTLTRTTTGAIGFEFDIVHRLCVDAPAQTGSFKMHLKNGANVIVGFEIEKTGNGTAGTVKYILNDKVVGTDTVDLSYYNTNFGYCNRTPVYVTQNYTTYVKKKVKGKKKKVAVTNTRTVQTGWNYTQSNLNSGIGRDGGVVTFSIGGLADRTFKDSDIENTSVSTVLFTTTGNFHTNALRSCAFVSKKGVPFADIPNVFTAGDIVEADCNDANVYLYRNGSADGHLEAQYGALGNDWEDFELKAGQNIIRAVWSSWVNASYKPVIKIIFNEVYI